MKNDGDLDIPELRRRVLHALANPLARLSGRFEVPLGDAVGHVRMAYFDMVKRTGVTLKQAGEALGISERQAKRLQKELREQFLDVDQSHSLPKRIEFLCWATPVSRTKLKQVLSGYSAKTIDSAVDELLASGRLREDEGRTRRLHADTKINSLVRDTWLNRIGGLQSLLANVTDAVYGRFFLGDKRTFSRTVSFLIRPEDVPELEALFAEHLVPTLSALDQKAREQGDGLPLRLSLLWAPLDLILTTTTPDTRDSEPEA